MAPAAIEKLVWVLIYGGLLLGALGAFVQRETGPAGWAMVALGAVAAGAGVVLIWVRSRIET